jgi:hypothetical protein
MPGHRGRLGLDRRTSRNAYRAIGKADEAIELYATALAGLERTLGLDHPQTALVRVNLAVARSQATKQEEPPPG